MSHGNEIEKAVGRIIDMAPQPGRKYPRVTNRQITGKRPKNSLESMGIDLLSKTIRDKINPILEEDYGIGLIPDDYRGTFRIVPVEERASHVLTKKLERIERQNKAVRDLTDYYTMLDVSNEFNADLLQLLDDLEYLDKTYEKLVMPSVHRMKSLLVDWSTDNDD